MEINTNGQFAFKCYLNSGWQHIHTTSC